MLGLSKDETMHAAAGFGRKAAVGIAKREFPEGVEGFARGIGVAFGKVLSGELVEPAVGFVEGGERLQVHHVVAVGVIGVGAQEPVGSLHGARRVAVLPGRVNEFDLGLLGVLTEGITRFELLVIVLSLRPVAIIQG